MKLEKLNDIAIKINDFEVKGLFSIETVVKSEYDKDGDIPLIKLIIDFYERSEGGVADFFESINVDDVVNIYLKLFGNDTLLNNMVLKKSNAHVPATGTGFATYRMIFKNR